MRFGIYFMDLFANALLIFMTLTVLAFSSISDGRERTLPQAELATVDRRAVGVSVTHPVALTARQAGDGIRYFVNADEVSRGDLPGRLAAFGPIAVVLRIDKRLPFEVAVDLMAMAQHLKIRNVSWAVLER